MVRLEHSLLNQESGRTKGFKKVPIAFLSGVRHYRSGEGMLNAESFDPVDLPTVHSADSYHGYRKQR